MSAFVSHVTVQNPRETRLLVDDSNVGQVHRIQPTTLTSSLYVGMPGPAGAASSGAYFQWTQGNAQTVWMIPHNLGFHPAVQTIGSDGDEVDGDVHHIDSSNLTVTFGYNLSGVAYLS